MITLFGDFSFFLLLALLLIPAFVLGYLEKPRRYYILFASIVFDCLAIGNDTAHIMFFVLYMVWEIVLLRLYVSVREKRGREGHIYAVFLVLCILPLALSKISGFLPIKLFQILGISYLTFKAAQIIIETYDGLIKELSVLDTLNFLLFFPCISSGPIDRSRRYEEDLKGAIPRAEYLELAGDGLFKLMLGLLYKVVLASLCYKGVQLFEESLGFSALVGYAYAYGLYMFFDFAGYSLMAVGVSQFFGIRTPANFDKPFLSKDIKDFWDRWHISLSHWFRDFLFSRFVMQSMRHKWFGDRLKTACAGFIVDMFVMGIWHGITPYYILYGLYHGVLLALTEVWQKKSKFYKKHKKDKWYRVLSWALTMQMVMFGFLLFSGKLFM